MIDIDLKYQVVLFGSYEDIAPKPEIIKFFIESFADKGLIPTTFQEVSPAGIINRFSLSSSDGLWLIEFSTNRIDIHKTNKDIGVTEIGTIEQFIVEAKEIVAIIDSKFPKKYNRMSLNTRYLLHEMDEEAMASVYKKLNNPIDIYQENPIADWSNRAVSRIAYEISENSELCNVISEVKRTTGNHTFNSKPAKIDRVELHFDLNTYQGNTDYRFDSNSLINFLDTISKVEADLKTKYLNLIEG
jgi:hypothetical protein